ncbi:MAG TPA: histidine phosphatase family protein [Candidatus Saccharimonadales bacterium]|nr:histidine phosphatase family protein [Candidatus Saccharimonadales bacterium]
MKEVYVLRHAEKDAAGELTDAGRQMARQLGGVLPEFTVVIASNSPRTIETATHLTASEPLRDGRAGYYQTAQEVSAGISRLAAEQSITFLEAAELYNNGELADGIRAQAAELNDLIDETMGRLSDGEKALVVSHDMTMTPALVQRDQPRPLVNYLSGYVIRDDGAVSLFEAQAALATNQ